MSSGMLPQRPGRATSLLSGRSGKPGVGNRGQVNNAKSRPTPPKNTPAALSPSLCPGCTTKTGCLPRCPRDKHPVQGRHHLMLRLLGHSHAPEKISFRYDRPLCRHPASNRPRPGQPGVSRFKVHSPSPPLNGCGARFVRPGTRARNRALISCTYSFVPITPESTKFRHRYRNTSTSPRT